MIPLPWQGCGASSATAIEEPAKVEGPPKAAPVTEQATAAADTKTEAAPKDAPVAAKMDLSMLDLFAEMDADSSGSLDHEELKSYILKLTIGQDGIRSSAAMSLEKMQLTEADIVTLFKTCDTNDDKRITMLEYSKGVKKFLKERESNVTGEVS